MRKHLEEKHLSEMHSAQSQISRMQGIIDDGATNHMELQRLKEVRFLKISWVKP